MRLAAPDDARASRAPDHPHLVSAGTGETVHVVVDAVAATVGAQGTDDALSMLAVTLSPGGGVPDHVHARDDETIYVLEGALDVRVGDARLALGAGGCAFAPRGTVHGFSNAGRASARLLLVASPAIEPQRAFPELAVGVPLVDDAPTRGDAG